MEVGSKVIPLFKERRAETTCHPPPPKKVERVDALTKASYARGQTEPEMAEAGRWAAQENR